MQAIACFLLYQMSDTEVEKSTILSLISALKTYAILVRCLKYRVYVNELQNWDKMPETKK